MMNVTPDTEEMSEEERKQAVERAGIPDPAERDDDDQSDGDDGLVVVE